MVSNLTQTKLVRLLKTLSKGEQEIEIVRQSLVRNPSFESYTAFKRIDRHSTNALSANEVTAFLQENKVIAGEKDLKCLFNTYSSNSGLRISYNDFQKLVLPRTNDRLRCKCLGRPVQAISKDEYLPDDIERSLAKFIKQEIDFLRQVEELKEDLSIRIDFGLMDAFMLIDTQKKGTLDFKALYSFLETKMAVYEDDIGALLARFDKNRDQVLSYTEFAEILQPVNPNYRLALRSASSENEAKSSSPERKKVLIESVCTPIKEKNASLEEDDYRETLNETARTDNQLRTSRFNKSPSYVGSPDYRESIKNKSILSKSPSPGRLSRANMLNDVSTIKSETIYSPSAFDRIENKEWRSPTVREKSPEYDQVEGFRGIENGEKRSLARFLKEELELEKGIEKVKKDLALQRKFNSFSLFRVFDLGVKGYITRTQLEDGLKELNLFPSKNELSLLMRRFDKRGNGMIRYSDFKQEIEPREGEHRLEEELKDGDVDYELRGLMRKLFNRMISSENTCEELRRSLRRQIHNTISDVFLNLQKNNKHSISTNVLREFLDNEGIYTSAEDARLLMTRFDKNNTGRISYSEFVEGLLQRLP